MNVEIWKTNFALERKQELRILSICVLISNLVLLLSKFLVVSATLKATKKQLFWLKSRAPSEQHLIDWRIVDDDETRSLHCATI